jgi:hypothetical protein
VSSFFIKSTYSMMGCKNSGGRGSLSRSGGGWRSQSAVSDFGTKEEEGRGQGDGWLTGGFLVLSIHRY